MSKRDELDSALLQRKRQYFSKPGMVCTVSFCQAWEDGSHAGYDQAIEEVLKKLWLAEECNRAIGLKIIKPENCFQDFCNLVTACLSIKSLREG